MAEQMTAARTSVQNRCVLKIAGLKVAYGGIQAVKGIDLEVHTGELVTLIGANGAGKTTTLKAITGTLPACKVEGAMEYDGPLDQGQHLVQPGQAEAGDGAGRARRVHPHEHPRKPADGRLHAQRQGRHRRTISKNGTASFRA